MQINQLMSTALGKFLAVSAGVVILAGVVLGYWFYSSMGKFAAIANIPPTAEYNLADLGNQAAYDRLKQAYTDLAAFEGKDPRQAPIIDPAINRANAFMTLGDTGRAILAYQWLNKYRPGGLQGFSNLADLYSKIGEYNKAEKNYLIAIKNSNIQHIEPYEGLFNLYQGYLKDKFPQIEQILLDSIAKTIAQGQPVGANFRSLLAQYYESVGRTGDAIVQYQEVLKDDPHNIGLQTKLKELGDK